VRLVQAPFRCDNCGRMSIASAPMPSSAASNYDQGWWSWQKPKWTPESVGGREFPDVPAHIASAADEAFQCRSISALRAAITMARSVIEATCKHHGIERGSLAAKIDTMTDRGLIRAFTKDAAHELRYLGNDMAHGDFVDDVDADDAEAVLEVMAEILSEVFQGPARVGRMRAKLEGTAASE
jgi:hypothetical protein